VPNLICVSMKEPSLPSNCAATFVAHSTVKAEG